MCKWQAESLNSHKEEEVLKNPRYIYSWNDKDKNTKRAIDTKSQWQSKWLWEEANKEMLTELTNITAEKTMNINEISILYIIWVILY